MNVKLIKFVDELIKYFRSESLKSPQEMRNTYTNITQSLLTLRLQLINRGRKDELVHIGKVFGLKIKEG